jgi:hypothetical protein
MFFVQVKAAGRSFNIKATCGGCDSLLIFIKKIKYSEAAMLPQAMLLTERSEIAK